jgi:hypothetical protein
MSPFNSNNLVAPRNFNFETDVFEDGPFPGTIEVPDLSGVFNDYDVFGAGSYPVPDFVDYGVDFGTGGYIPEASNAYDFDFGGAARTGTTKPGGFLGNLVGSVGDFFSRRSTSSKPSKPSNPYASLQVSRSFGEPRSSYVYDTQQRMGSLLANVIDSFKEPRSVI